MKDSFQARWFHRVSRSPGNLGLGSIGLRFSGCGFRKAQGFLQRRGSASSSCKGVAWLGSPPWLGLGRVSRLSEAVQSLLHFKAYLATMGDYTL